jgi:poly-gamma-glutamate capsule biosynthesis protein CapA/YwtB (metallophosphatase superfamily)
MTPKEYTINFAGDVMLGRLIDQLFPTHVSNALDESHMQAFRARHADTLGLNKYTAQSPWGNTLALFTSSDLNMINLETSITTFSTPWPDKAFNYRMHPANAAPILAAAEIDFACLANNHTLDFGTEGLVETVWTLKHSDTHRVAIAGAGETTLEAIAPAVLELPRSKSQRGVKHGGRPGPLSKQDLEERHNYDDTGRGGKGKYLVNVYAATDHPQAWRDIPTFHLIDYSETSREHLRRVIQKHSSSSPDAAAPSLKVFSIHWGPNYRWHPHDEIRSLAHFLLFECGIDIVHGHSSHHVQGIECPAPGKVVIYGCGDFVDDYALNKEFRNDLGAVYRVVVQEDDGRVKPVRLEVFPTRISHFQVNLLLSKDEDHGWVVRNFRALTGKLMQSSSQYGHSLENRNIIRPELGDRGELVVDLV